jgi:UDP-glucose 4-epimerase
MRILVTGGAGYIGSHTATELLDNGHEVIVVDNLINSNQKSIGRVEEITGKKIKFYNIDLCDSTTLEGVFRDNQIDAIIHFAGLKAVGESTKKPLLYYRNNLTAAISVLEFVEKYNVNKLVFSSSATVYGSSPIPYVETNIAGQAITSPYGRTKYMIEQIIHDFSICHPEKTCAILRYFNPIGAHESGLIGEDPQGIPNNLMPFITKVASRKLDKLSIFGNDYDTPDGTCIRDYIHVVDLAKGHLCAMEKCKPGFNIFNLGSGIGISVLNLVNTFIRTTGQEVPYEIVARRPGDLPAFYANPSKANKELGWRTQKTIEEACIDAWRWQSKNPNGYEV